MGIKNSSAVAQKKMEYVATRQPDLGAWLTELSEINKAYSQGTLTKASFKLFGAGLVIEEPDEELLIEWLEDACRALNINFEVLDLGASPELVERLDQGHIELSVRLLKTGDWLFERCSDEREQKTRASLIEVLRKEKSLSIFVTYSRWFSEVAESLRFEGLFDRYFRWAEPSAEMLADGFIRETGPRYFDKSISNDRLRLGRLLSMDYPTKRQQGLLKMGLQRKCRELGRPMTWHDVITMAINGTGKGHVSVDEIDPFNVAVHEAGHAVMCIETSQRKNIPEYVSILPNRYSLGQAHDGVNWAYERNQSRTFEQSLGRIKVYLAGRAAEEVVFGHTGVAAHTASADLEEATQLSYRLIAKNGFHSRYGQGESTGMNLLVVEDDAPEAQKAAAYLDSARLLSNLYEETKRILVENISLLMAISNTLVESKVLFEEDIKSLLREYEGLS